MGRLVDPVVVSLLQRGDFTVGERADPVTAKLIPQRLGVEVHIGGETAQVARVPAGDLLADRRLALMASRSVNVEDRQGLDVHEEGYLHSSVVVVSTLGVVAAGTVAIEAGAVDRNEPVNVYREESERAELV